MVVNTTNSWSDELSTINSNNSNGTTTIQPDVTIHGTCIKFNQSDPFHIGDKYGGIPRNLLTNTIGWSVLLIMFVFIRKNAVKKMGIRLASSTVDSLTTQWQHVFFGRDNDASEEISEEEPNVIQSNVQDDDKDIKEVLCKEDGDSVVIDNTEVDNESTMKSTRILTFKEKKLLGLMGPDAVQYLRFQKYIIMYVLLTTTVSLGVILPLNFQGSQLGNATDFGHTTLANLNPNDDDDNFSLWIHVVVAFLLFPAAIFLMRRFSIGLKIRDTSLKITRTVAIENIPKNVCNIKDIKQHFSEAYPDFEIYDVQVVYNVTKLIEVSDQLENVVDSLKFSQRYKEGQNKELTMIPMSGARCCSCFCMPCVNKVDCVEFFTDEEVRLRTKLKQKGEEAIKSTLGMAFVTFFNINHTRKVLRDHKNSILHLKHQPPVSRVRMRQDKWRVWYAPPPNDIIWENLTDKRRWRLTMKVFANIFIFIVAFFLTTPQFVVHQLDPILNALKNLTRDDSEPITPSPGEPSDIIDISGNETNDIVIDGSNSTDIDIFHKFRSLPAWMTDFLPTLMIWTFTALLPVVVAYADRLVGHWTRSGQNHAIMKKTFWYLLFMVIVLPTFGFTSAQTYIDFLIRNSKLNWECIFLPDSGAFFVNYVITAAMIGSGLELIRFPDLFWYLIQICCSRSKADNPAIRKEVICEFRFGEQYARMMLIFAMVVMFSISCPLITPFGCLYFILKHLVDRHNLAFVYARSKISKKVHATAINFVIMSVALLQFFMIVFSVIRSLDSDFQSLTLRTKVSIGLFIFTLNVCSAQIWSNTCRKLSPIKYEDVLLGEDPDDEHNQIYLPHVLDEFLPDVSVLRASLPSTVKNGYQNGYQTF